MHIIYQYPHPTITHTAVSHPAVKVSHLILKVSHPTLKASHQHGTCTVKFHTPLKHHCDCVTASVTFAQSSVTTSQFATLLIWYKQWKVRSGCLEKVALGNSRGLSDFPKGRSPEGKSDDPREFPRATFSRQPLRTFHCLSEFWLRAVMFLQIYTIVCAEIRIHQTSAWTGPRTCCTSSLHERKLVQFTVSRLKSDK